MTTRTTPWPAGTPCWVDTGVADLEAAKAFYGSVFGWSYVDTGADFGHYTLAQVDGKSVAALSPPPPGGAPSPWTVYVASDDAAATAKLITEHGGGIVVEPMPVPGMGTMVIASDPTGGMFGVWQAEGMVGFELANEPGAVTWTDTRLTDSDAGRSFYAAVFGYAYQPLPGEEMDYGTFSIDGGEPVGGIGGMMGAPEGTPSHWFPYFNVADVDGAQERLAAGGGTVLMSAEDTPFGRIGIYLDPFGSVFGMHQTLPEQ